MVNRHVMTPLEVWRERNTNTYLREKPRKSSLQIGLAVMHPEECERSILKTFRNRMALMIRLNKLVDDERRSFRATDREWESEQAMTCRVLLSVRKVTTEQMKEDTVPLTQETWEHIDLIQPWSNRNRGRNEKRSTEIWMKICLTLTRQDLASTTASVLLPPTLHTTTSILLPKQAHVSTTPLASRLTLCPTGLTWKTTAYLSAKRWLVSIVTCRMALTMGLIRMLITTNLRWHSPCHLTMMRWQHTMCEVTCHHCYRTLSMDI